MTHPHRTMKLGLFLDRAGHHLCGWRHPDCPADQLLQLQHYQQLAQTAERGCMDMVFLADSLTLLPVNNVEFTPTFWLDPLVLQAGIAAVTRHIGLAATVSTSYSEPYNTARQLATLDVLSGGRAAWNLVTSMRDEEGRNYNRDSHMGHAERYERAEEFLTVVRKLWNSWEPDAIVADKARGRYAHPAKVHASEHKGPHFSVQGPLNVPRSPQGHPVIIQAGSSSTGREFAARSAEVIFTVTPNLTEAQAFYRDIKQLTVQHGRRAQDVNILPGIIPLIGGTPEQAQALRQQLEDLLVPEAAVRHLSMFLEVNLLGYPLEGPLPELPPVAQVKGQKGRYEVIQRLAHTEGLNLGQISKRIASTRAHHVVAGTPEQIADLMQHWFDNAGCDGFNVLPPYFPKGLDDFVDGVIPVLQKRGLFRTAYTGTTLRDHLGLAVPPWQSPTQPRQALAA